MQSSYGQYGSNQSHHAQQQQPQHHTSQNLGGQMTPVGQHQQGSATLSSEAVSSLFSRLEAMTKTQTDLITYLHAELDRRREWEDRMLKDVQNRHGVLVSLLSNMIGFPPPPPAGPPGGPVGPPGAAGGPHHPGAAGAMAHVQHHGDPAAAAAAAAAGISAPPGGGGMQNGMYMGGTGGRQQQPAMNAYANHPRDHMPSQPINGGKQTRISLSGQPAALHRGAGDGGMGGIDMHGLVDSSLGAADSGGAGGGGNSKTKRKRRASDASSDDGANKAVEVDERGVVYMASGKKAGLKPTKIQALVRKTIWASMGPEASQTAHPPSYVEGMNPPDGSREWRFGNLRFEWEKTSKRSPHNNHMKQIIINHILALRQEYPEVPDGDFQPSKMEAAFEQAFSTWRGKVLGRVKGRHDNDDD